METEETMTEQKPTRQEVLQEKAKNSEKNKKKITESQHSAAREGSLEAAKKAQLLIRGRIVAVEAIGEDERCLVCAVVIRDGKTKILIPYADMYNKELMDMTTVDLETVNGRRKYIARQKQMLAKLIGLETSFCIKEIVHAENEGETDLITASRKMANEKLRKAFFFDKEKCVVGNTYQATILSVTPHSLSVSFNGYDTAIPQYMLTERYLRDMTSYYHTGEKINFVLTDIKYTDDNTDVESIGMDTKAAELEDMKSRQYLISPNTITRAYITRVYKSKTPGKINIFAWLPDYEMAAKVAQMNANDFGREPESGDELQIIITGFNHNGYLDARCRSLHGTAGMFYDIG